VLIETVLAASRWTRSCGELRRSLGGLNIGRWDYMFSCIKKFRSHKDFLPRRSRHVRMTARFMRAYAAAAVKTCHHRHAPRWAAWSAQIPIKNDPTANEAAMAKVREDKLREVTDGCDGTWVAHRPGADRQSGCSISNMPGANQYDRSVRGEHQAKELSTSSRKRRSRNADCAITFRRLSSISAPGSPAMAACRYST